MLDQVDAWVESGVLGGERPNAADFQIAPSIGLAMTLDDLRPAITGPPRGKAGPALRPELPGADAAGAAGRVAGAAARQLSLPQPRGAARRMNLKRL